MQLWQLAGSPGQAFWHLWHSTPHRSGVGVPLAQRPVIHAQRRRRGVRRQGRPPDQPQQGVPARGQAHAVAKTCAGRAAKRDTYGRQPLGQPRRLACPGRCDAGQAFGEDAALAPRVVAEEFPYAEMDGNGVLAPQGRSARARSYQLWVRLARRRHSGHDAGRERESRSG